MLLTLTLNVNRTIFWCFFRTQEKGIFQKLRIEDGKSVCKLPFTIETKDIKKIRHVIFAWSHIDDIFCLYVNWNIYEWKFFLSPHQYSATISLYSRSSSHLLYHTRALFPLLHDSKTLLSCGSALDQLKEMVETCLVSGKDKYNLWTENLANWNWLDGFLGKVSLSIFWKEVNKRFYGILKPT